MAELKPCPFCGEKPITRISFRTQPCGTIKASVDVRIVCHKCGCCKNVVLELCDTDFEKAHRAMEDACRKWNIRVLAREEG